MDTFQLRQLAFTQLRVQQLAKDRGFFADSIVLDENTVERTMTSIYQRAIEQKKSLAEVCWTIFHKTTTSLQVFFLDFNQDLTKKRMKMISTDQVKSIKDTFRNLGLCEEEILLLSPNKWSAQAKKEDFSDWPNMVNVLFDDLLFRIPEHEMQVPHVPIREDEFVLHAGQIKPEDLPKISKKDPVVQWFGFPSGTILKICDPAFTSFRVVAEL